MLSSISGALAAAVTCKSLQLFSHLSFYSNTSCWLKMYFLSGQEVVKLILMETELFGLVLFHVSVSGAWCPVLPTNISAWCPPPDRFWFMGFPFKPIWFQLVLFTLNSCLLVLFSGSALLKGEELASSVLSLNNQFVSKHHVTFNLEVQNCFCWETEPSLQMIRHF